MKPKSLLPPLQEPANCSCPETDQSCLGPHPFQFLKIELIKIPLLRMGLANSLFPLCFPQNPACTFSFSHTCYILTHYSSRFEHPNNVWWVLIIIKLFNIRGGTDKSLARPGRKQATATKLGDYSTYSPRSSIHFLVRCSTFASHSKKKFRRLSVQPGLRGSNDLHVGRKMATFQLFFSPGNRW